MSRVRGTLGILAQAKREDRIPSLGEALDLLRARGTWVDQTPYEQMLRVVGE